MASASGKPDSTARADSSDGECTDRYGPATYLVRAGQLCVAACRRIEQLATTDVPHSSATSPQLRQISLTLAAVERLLATQCESLITAEGQSPLPRGSSLPEVVARIKELPPRVLRRRFPAGGLVSVCYTLSSTLDDLLDCLKDVKADPDDSRAIAGLAAGGAVGLGAALVIRRLRRAVAPVALPKWMFGSLLALFVGLAARRGYKTASIRGRLDGLNQRLVLILRILVIAGTIFQDTNRHGPGTGSSPRSGPVATTSLPAAAAAASEAEAEGTGPGGGGASPTAAPGSPGLQPLGGRRRWSRADLIGDLSDTEFDRHVSAPARRMLEATSLPNAASELGTSRHRWLRVLKYFLDVVYSAAHVGYDMDRRLRAAQEGGGALGMVAGYARLLRPVATAVAGAWYGVQPAVAAERASSVLHDADIGFVSEVWRASDSRAARVLAGLTMTRVTVNVGCTVSAVPCHVVAHLPDGAPGARGWAAGPGDRGAPAAALRALLEHCELPVELERDALSTTGGEGGPRSGGAPRLASGGADAAVGPWPWRRRLPAAAWAPPAAVPVPGDVTILLYVHGGGFVGSSFAADVVLLARWAKAHPGMVVLYPHYTLSPEARFPVALDECFRAYMAARRAADAAVAAGRRGRVVVFGESAGGNLASAVCVRCASVGAPPPDRLVLGYPALNLNSVPSPSRALHLSDPIVPLRMLQRLAAAYMPEGCAGRLTRDPEINPGLACDEVLSRFPRTEIVLGGLDPLLDDGIEMHTRLRRLGVEGEMLVYRALPHGFFTFNALPPAQGAIRAVEMLIAGKDGLGLA